MNSKMNWLQKLCQVPGPPDEASADELYDTFGDPKEWQPGMRGLLSHFGYKDFSVVRIIPFSQVVDMSQGYYKWIDDDHIKSTNSFGGLTHREGESVPCVIEANYGKFYAQSQSNAVGRVRMVGAQNIYRTLMDLIKYQLKTLYPDYMLSIMDEEHIQELIADYPQLRGKGDVPDLIDYQVFMSDQGYEVQVVRDPKAYVSLGRTEAEFPFYWYIPELDKRSLYISRSKDKCFVPSIGGGGRYPDLQSALDAAEKYLDCLFTSDLESIE